MELIEPVAKDVRQARPHAVGAHPNGLSDHYNNQVPSQAPLFPRLAACPISQATTSLHPACSAMSSGPGSGPIEIGTVHQQVLRCRKLPTVSGVPKRSPRI